MSGYRKMKLCWVAFLFAYISLGIIARFSGWYHYWDIMGPVEVTRRLLEGDLNIYILNYGEHVGKIPYTAYPPLLPFALAPVVYISDLIFGKDEVTFALAGLPIIIFDVLAIYMILKIMEQKVRLSWELRIFLTAVMLFGLGFFHASVYMSHQESMTLFLILLGFYLLTCNRYVLGGVSLSLAMLSMHTAILALLPLIFIFVGDKLRSEKIKASAFLIAFVAPIFVTLYPFYQTNPDATYDALLGHTARLRLKHESLWKALDVLVGYVTPPETYQQIHNFLMIYTVPAPLIGALIISIIAMILKIKFSQQETVLAAMTLSAYLMLIVSKTVSPHYYVVPLGPLVVWDAVKSNRLPIFGLTASIWLWAIHNVEWSYQIGIMLIISNIIIFSRVLGGFIKNCKCQNKKPSLLCDAKNYDCCPF
ncbi:MAG: glycosyltransferase 87 family protein [Nitrososphaerota archaeon]